MKHLAWRGPRCGPHPLPWEGRRPPGGGPPRWRHPHRRLFWRVYLHGLFLLLVVGLTVAILARAFKNNGPWHHLPERYAEVLSDRWERCQGEAPCLASELSFHHDLLRVETTLYRLSGEQVASSASSPPAPLERAEVERLRGPRNLPGLGWRVALPLTVGGHPVGYALVSFDGGAERSLTRFVAILVGVLVVLALASFPLVRTTVEPITRITHAARALGRGDLSARTGVPRQGEIGELAAAFDDMATRLETMIRGQQELLSGVSHELRTPLARIRFGLELAESGDADEARRYLAELSTDVAELERLVDDVLVSSRLTLAQGAGKLPLHEEVLDGGALLDAAAERFRSRHPEHTLTVADESRPHLRGDFVLLRRVVDNLLENAARYGGAPIQLRSSQEGARWVIEVTDHGAGIPPEDLPHVFEPFFRGERSRSREGGGVGLGLTLCQRIVTAHGGEIRADSRPGEQTTFRFALPLPPEGEEAA